MKTLQEAVEYCATFAYNHHMNGSNFIWYGIPIAEMAWVFGIPKNKFFEMCEAAFKAKFTE